MNPIHRVLIRRLAIVTALMAFSSAVLAYFILSHVIDKSVVNRTVQGAAAFNEVIKAQLDSPGFDKEAQRIIDGLPASAIYLPAGKFVMIRVLDREFRPIAGSTDAAYGNAAALWKYSEKSVDYSAIGKQGHWDEMARINGSTFIRVVYPFTNSSGSIAAYSDTVFALSVESWNESRRIIMYSSAAAVGIVIITALTLYPAIIRMVKKLSDLSLKLLGANYGILKVLGSAVAKRDSDTDIHNFRVTIYAVRLAEAVGLDSASIRVLIKGAFLHDVGKIGIRDAILHKPGDFTGEEYAEMKQHVNHGLDIIGNAEWLADAAAVVGGHHEKFDGTGYKSVRGSEIPLIARIFSIADVFDALTSKRPYKEPFGFEKSMSIILEGRGSFFDPGLVDAFVPIARELYDRYITNPDAHPQDDLIEIGGKYFISEIAVKL